MEQLTKDLAENQKKLDELLGVGRNYDVISRDLYIGAWKGRLYVIDGYGDDGVIERITSFLLGEGAALGKGVSDMQEFIDRCVTFCEVDCENQVDKILTGAFLGKTILLLEVVLQGEMGVPDAAAEEGRILHQRLREAVVTAPEDLAVAGLLHAAPGELLRVDHGAVIEALQQQDGLP